ncbi:MAG: family 16 glycosylhydrolase [Bacteroidota bacterium]
MNRIHLIFLLLLSGYNYSIAQCPQVLWEDEFEQTVLDTNKWSFQLGDGCDINLCGWGNNELQWYQSENVEIVDGTLRIIAKEEQVNDKPYTSARIRTLEKGDWTYGRFEASIKLPTGKGMWPAFWMLPTQQVYGGWPQSGEIDIVELVGSEPNQVHGTIHYGQPWPKNTYAQGSYRLQEGEFIDQFHTFAVEWEKDEIRWLLDDYVYSTKHPEDIAPNKWPFDQAFHFVLNLAVGGNWPGNPDATTTFPQTMEVEYVRVFDGFFPSLSGKRKVEQKEEAVKYTILNAPEGSTFTWTLPAGATLVEGQGTPEITVDWGEAGGTVKVAINSTCKTQEITLDVSVKAPLAKLFSLEDFETDSKQLSYTFSSGTFTNDAKNPAPNAVNTSALSGKYVRNKANRYDVLTYSISNLDIKALTKETQTFFIDIYTSAPVGTEIVLQLENKSRAQASAYPKGRHSRFNTHTQKQNEWHRLEFTFVEQLDTSITQATIDQLVLLFAPNSESGDTYYFDHFDVYSSVKDAHKK